MNNKKPQLYTPQVFDLLSICEKRVAVLYGTSCPAYIQERAQEELNAINKHGNEAVYWLMMQLTQEAEKQGLSTSVRGSLSASFVAFLLGITGINPLPAHYFCPECNYIKFVPSALSGYDLHSKNCPECKSPLKSGGQDIPFFIFAGLDGSKDPDVGLNIPPEFQETAYKFLQNPLPEHEIVRIEAAL